MAVALSGVSPTRHREGKRGFTGVVVVVVVVVVVISIKCIVMYLQIKQIT